MDIHTNSGQVLMPHQVLEAHTEDYGPVTKNCILLTLLAICLGA